MEGLRDCIVVGVMDREADIFELFAAAGEHKLERLARRPRLAQAGAEDEQAKAQDQTGALISALGALRLASCVRGHPHNVECGGLRR